MKKSKRFSVKDPTELNLPSSSPSESSEAFKLEEQGLDERTREEVRKLVLENDRLSAENESLTDDNKGRRNFSDYIFTLVCLWMFFVLVTLIAVGRGFMFLSEKVIITLLTTTTVEVIGLIIIVANYFFKGSDNSKNKANPTGETH